MSGARHCQWVTGDGDKPVEIRINQWSVRGEKLKVNVELVVLCLPGNINQLSDRLNLTSSRRQVAKYYDFKS